MNFVLKESVMAGLIGGAIAACLAFCVNQYLVPFPQSVFRQLVG